MISSRRDGNIDKRTKLKSFLTLDRRSVSPHRPAQCARAVRGQWAIWLAPRLSLATETTGTVLIPSQMSEIAGHDDLAFSLILRERCSFCSCSAKKRKAALRAASRFFALLAAAARFRCSVHGNCSAPPTLSQILQPCDRALSTDPFFTIV